MNFGKFKDAESLLRSYENLEKEFTKKCQELARLRFAKINENEMNTEGGVLPRGREIENPEADTKNDRVQDAGGVKNSITNIVAKSSVGLACERERAMGEKTTLDAKNELSAGSGRRDSENGKMESGRRESVDDKVERGGLACEIERATGKKTALNGKNELSVESGKSERVDDKMVSGKSEREAFGMKNNAEIKSGGVIGTKEKTNKLNAFLDKVYPPEESKCSKSKIENGETFLGSDLEEAGADKSSPFCGILESARSVLEGSAVSENNLGEEELLREDLSFEKNGSGGLSEHKSQNETFNENESFGGSENQNGSFNGGVVGGRKSECGSGNGISSNEIFSESGSGNLNGRGSLNGNRSECEDLNRRQGGSGLSSGSERGSLSGRLSENETFNGNESLSGRQSGNRSSLKNGSEVENAQGFNQGDNLKAQKNDWSYGNDEESNINFGKNETEREGKIENVPTNVNASKPENAVIGTMTPELLELMLEKARTDGVQDYIKRVLDKKSNSPKLLGKSVRGDGLILNSGVKPLENIREAGNYILKNYFFD